MKKIFLIIVGFLLLYECEVFCSNEKNPKDTSVEDSILSEVPPKKEKYKYQGLSFRDPFIPLSGEKVVISRLGLGKDAVVPSLSCLTLKGVVSDKDDKIALFSSPYGSYILAKGKLYDNQNRLVKGIWGKVVVKESGRKKSVVLITEENYYREYSLSEKSQSGKNFESETQQ